jgi:hypothetical protein
MVAFIIKLFFINSINNQVVINYYFNNNTFDTLPITTLPNSLSLISHYI